MGSKDVTVGLVFGDTVDVKPLIADIDGLSDGVEYEIKELLWQIKKLIIGRAIKLKCKHAEKCKCTHR